LRLTAPDLLHFGLIDAVIPEPAGGAQEDPDRAAEFVRQPLQQALAELSGQSPARLIDDRYNKFRRMGQFFTETVA
jgi:acetyl-CoA carboxylase alpha subunit